MELRDARAIAVVVATNLLSFIAVVSLPAFQAAHHHWIFPILAASLAAQWALTLAPWGLVNRPPIRDAVLSAMALLLVVGIARHATILACFDRCSFKLAAAAATAGIVFSVQRFLGGVLFWDRLRSGLAAIGCLLWAAYLVARGMHLSSWIADIAMTIAALFFWLGRERAEFLVAALGIALAIAIRATGNEYIVIGLAPILNVAVPLAAVHAVDRLLKERSQRRLKASAEGVETPLGRRIFLSALRVSAAVAVLAGLGLYAAGPIFFMAQPAERQAYLRKVSPAYPARDPRTLSPLARRLRGHVVHLAETIGERDAGNRGNQEKARDYIMEQFRRVGYVPKSLGYKSKWMAAIKNDTEFYNVEAIQHAAPGDGRAWILGAHYDTTTGTPGADDNASGVAVLLEAARLLKQRRTGSDIRFVAFGTEEPPAFGTRNMGSHHYARHLKDNGVQVRGMVSLEMLGFYNSKPGSQLYPPFLHLFYPDHGSYVGAVSDVKSRKLLASFKAAWDARSTFKLTVAVLPGPFSGLALSDQLNFWDQGFSAIMLSDTAFYRNPNYHEASDRPDTLDYEKMADVTRALVGTVGRED